MIMSGDCITGIEKSACLKAMETLSDEQKVAFIEAYNKEYKRIRKEVYAQEAKLMDELWKKY